MSKLPDLSMRISPSLLSHHNSMFVENGMKTAKTKNTHAWCAHSDAPECFGNDTRLGGNDNLDGIHSKRDNARAQFCDVVWSNYLRNRNALSLLTVPSSICSHFNDGVGIREMVCMAKEPPCDTVAK